MTQKTATHPIKRLAQSRIECSITFEPSTVSQAEQMVLKEYQKQVTVKGFRPGHAPLEMVRADLGPDRLLNQMVRYLLPPTLSAIITEHQLKPIISPSISVMGASPLTLKIILIEHPSVTVKKIPSIDKKKISVQDEDIQRVIDYTLKQYQQTEFTDACVREKLGGTSVASFKEEVRKNLISYEEQRESRRREHALLDAIRDAVQVDLAPELLAEEERILTEEFFEDLKRANVLLDDWCKQMKKTPEDLAKDLKQQTDSRLKIRFGIQHLIQEQSISVDDQMVQHAAHPFLQRLSEHERREQEPLYQKGEEGYERLKWKLQVETLIKELLR